MDINLIRRAVASDRYEISQHAERERRNDGLSLADIENAVQTGKVIEDYPDDPRGSSCLVWYSDGRVTVVLYIWWLVFSLEVGCGL